MKSFGTPESEASASQGKDAVGSIDVLCDILHGILGFEDPKGNMEFQRVHRMGKSVRGKPRPILARFLRHQHRETVLCVGFDLKDTEYDFARRPSENHREEAQTNAQIKGCKKRGGQKVSFGKSEPDRLPIDGKFISA